MSMFNFIIFGVYLVFIVFYGVYGIKGGKWIWYDYNFIYDNKYDLSVYFYYIMILGEQYDWVNYVIDWDV